MSDVSLVGASRTTHLKIAFVAAAASGLLTLVAAGVHRDRNDEAAARTVIQARKPIATVHLNGQELR